MPGGELGIDFGTSNTVAVMRRSDGRTQPLLFEGSPLLPSSVYAEPTGALVVGRDAVQSSRLDPARFEPNPKRRIDDGTVLLGDRELPVADLIQAVLGRVISERQRATGATEVPSATLTCPAVWGGPRRQALTEAAGRAGLTDVRLVAEPVAAATYFAQSLGRDVPIGSVVVVHDFGAGTFDASVVARTSSGFDVLAIDGRDDIGGLDIDAAIIAHLEQLYAPRAPEAWARLSTPSTVEERRAKRLLWDDVRAAKERLSRNPTADLVVPLADLEVHLTRDELETLAKPLLEQTVRVTQGLIRWSNLAPGRLAGVFLVGGSSRIPLLATLLHRELGEPPVVLEQPELVVAEGSILAGALALEAAVDEVAGPSTGVLPRLTPEMFGSAGMPIAALPAPVSPAPPASAPESPPEQAPVSPATPVPIAAEVAPSFAVGRVIVPGAKPPGQTRTPAAATSPTRQLPRYEEPAPAPAPVRPQRTPAPVPSSPPRPAPRPTPQVRWPGPRRPSLLRRLLVRLVIVLLLIVVPVTAAAVAYYLTAGELPNLDRLLRNWGL